MFFVHKGLENKSVKKLSQDEIQELLNNGWKPGKAPSHWVTDGHTDILLKECLPLPEGFRYGQSDDNRYPFSCDFYIKSLDLFIELNIHPSHGDHLFDENNKEDSKLLEQLKIENSNWSNMIVDVWSRRDVEKYNYVIKNNLNCKFIYSSDFNDFINNVKEKRL